MSTADQLLSVALHGTAMRYAAELMKGAQLSDEERREEVIEWLKARTTSPARAA